MLRNLLQKTLRLTFCSAGLHSLTGVIFGGVSGSPPDDQCTLIEGVRHEGSKDIYQQQVNIIHGLPLLPAIEWTFIYLPILYHTFYGFWIIATGQPNVDRYRYGKNWFYLMQRISAIVLVFFMAFHILGMKGCVRW